MNNNNLNIDYLRIEIAILQEDVLSTNPGRAKFKIPTIITESFNDTINVRTHVMTGTTINIEDTIDLDIPTEYTYFYGADIVPAGTRFLVAFVGGNVNNIKIIGRYD